MHPTMSLITTTTNTISLLTNKKLTNKYGTSFSQISKIFSNWGSNPGTISGFYVWTDGSNIYYSNGSSQYVFDKELGTWSKKTWSGLNISSYSSYNSTGYFYGNEVWTDGTNIYYSRDENTNLYKLNKSNSTWTVVSSSFYASGYYVDPRYIWTDGTNIYYNRRTQSSCIFNKSTKTWTTKTWTNTPDFQGGYYVWTDGTNIYYSYSNKHYVLNKSTSTWTTKTWPGLNNSGNSSYDSTGYFSGSDIWTDGSNIYYSNKYYSYGSGTTTYYNYIINGSSITPVEWNLTNVDGGATGTWTDGTNIYYSYTSQQYGLVPGGSKIYTKDSKVFDCYVGNNKVKSIYLGATKIYET